ncbi:MAG TPA: S8 family serine peptidase [Chryseolinea sp.]
MKTTLLYIFVVACIAAASQLISCTTSYKPVRHYFEPGMHTHYDSSRYRLHEVIVIYKKPPTLPDVQTIRDWMHRNNSVDTTKIERQKCNSCNGYMELWQAPDIHSVINADGIAGGTVSPKGSKGVGEDGIAYYSLNFYQNIPIQSIENFGTIKFDSVRKRENDRREKEVVRIAVLDTGVDTAQIINPSYLWKNQSEASMTAKQHVDDDSNCYTDDVFGWNFIGKNNNVHDDNNSRHGTLVSQYIINQFAGSGTRAVELITLKTHDARGQGDLFSAICAIYYAMEKEAKIINASWGFYYYDKDPHPFLDSLITQVLRGKGILFVAAAGNRTAESDEFAHDAYKAEHGIDIPDSYLRNLEYHNFYPACLSRSENNVIAVTTADKVKVSPTQNYSEQYVDAGAFPDDTNTMRFLVPFPDTNITVSGSSFAAPIISGRIGALLPAESYVPGINKGGVLSQMEGSSSIERSSSLTAEHIRLGRITKQN